MMSPTTSHSSPAFKALHMIELSENVCEISRPDPARTEPDGPGASSISRHLDQHATTNRKGTTGCSQQQLPSKGIEEREHSSQRSIIRRGGGREQGTKVVRPSGGRARRRANTGLTAAGARPCCQSDRQSLHRRPVAVFRLAPDP